MRGWATAVLFSSLFLFPATVLPQCDYRLDYSGQYRSSAFDVSVDGNDLWMATGYGVALYDRSVDPPRLLDSIRLPGLTRFIRARNGRAYAASAASLTTLQKSGASITAIATTNAHATINGLDFRSGGNALVAATSSGIGFSGFLNTNDPATIALWDAAGSNALSAVADDVTGYSVDGSGSIQRVNTGILALPPNLPSFSTALSATSIHLLGDRLWVSDGRQSEVLTLTGTSLAVVPFATTNIVEISPNIFATAGPDRQMRILDVTTLGQPVTLFEASAFPTGGTVNRITALALASGRLYVAGGDMGLTTYDTSRFAAPYPVRSYSVGPPNSVVAGSDAVFIGLAAGGIQELARSSTGSLTLARKWGSGTVTVQDESSSFLLGSVGSALSMWGVAPGPPTPPLVSTATFATTIRSAGLNGTTAAVLLEDGSLWTIDMSQASPAPHRAAATIGAGTQLAVSKSGVAATEVQQDGTTVIHYWSGMNLDAAPVNATVSGSSTALALDGATAAVFTFRGITVVNFGAGAPSTRVLPQSNTSLVTSLRISGDRLLAIVDNVLRVWDLSTDTVQTSFVLPGSPTGLDVGGSPAIAAVATTTGVVSVNYSNAALQPAAFAQTASNAYYRKAVATASRLYLFDGRTIDIFEIRSSPAPRFIASVGAAGVIDLAATDAGLFTLSSGGGVVTAYGRDGALIASKALDEGTDVAPLAISAVGGAPWVSISRGCLSSGCEKKTIVLDPQTLIRSASLSGGIVDVTTTSSRAYALTELPAEIRVYDVSDPLHPAQLTNRANDVNAVAIGYASGSVYALADKVYVYNESSLTRTGEQLASSSATGSARIRVDGGCATLSGRSAAAETYSLPQWTAAAPLSLPGAIRTLAFGGGRLLILTDYSIEIWSRGAKVIPARRRATR